MSVRQGNKLIAGATQGAPCLFDIKWADHILDNMSWLRADTFSWQSGAIYQAAYAHLVLDIDDKALQSETISGTTIQFYLGDDGHKICPASEESNVTAIYNATGVAWYYIVDTTNQRFKLPRTKFGFTGIRSGVGNFVPAGLPDHYHNVRYRRNDNSGYHADGSVSPHIYTGSNLRGSYPSLNASESNSIYGNSDTVQPKATQMYLYFYVGNFTQTALENTAGVTTEALNTKVTIGHEVVEFQEPTAANNYTWYRKYRDGWVEQGGQFVKTGGQNALHEQTLPVPMANAAYYANVIFGGGAGDSTVDFGIIRTTTTLKIYPYWASTGQSCPWFVSGKAA